MRTRTDKLITSQSPNVHPVYIRLLCEALRKRGLDSAALLQAAGLGDGSISETSAQISSAQLITLLRLVRHQCQDPMLAIEWGRRIRANVHGMVGSAIFSSGTVRHALRTAVMLAPLRTTVVRLNLKEAAGWASLEFEATMALHDLDEFITTVIAFSVLEVIRALIGRSINRLCIEFPFSSPVWAEQRKQHCPSDVLFGAQKLVFGMPVELLDKEIATADSNTHDTAMQLCQFELLRNTASFTECIAGYLASHTGSYPTLDQAADYFYVSPRTLRRKLHQENLSYQKMLDQARMDKASSLIRESNLSIQEVAAQIGYSDPSNFIRAFRNYHGCTPRQFRDGMHNAGAIIAT